MKRLRIHIKEGKTTSSDSLRNVFAGLPGEKWTDIDGFDGFYQVSNMGRIRSWYELTRDKNTGQTISELASKPSIRKTFVNSNGYETITLSFKGKVKSYRVHRLVADSFLEKRSGKNDVNHKNGIKTDNRAINLEWVSRSRNLKHAYENNLKTWTPDMRRKVSESQTGSSNNQSKLNELMVIELRDKYASGNYTYQGLADEYGISHFTAGNIIRRETWKHI